MGEHGMCQAALTPSSSPEMNPMSVFTTIARVYPSQVFIDLVGYPG